MNGPGDRLPLIPKNIVTSGKAGRILDGRLPDSFYAVNINGPGITRLDLVALKKIERFSEEIESVGGVEGFENFYESISRGNYFISLESDARSLGLDTELSEILSRNSDLVERAHSIFMKMQNGEPSTPNEVEQIIKGYKDFLAEVKTLFEHFRDTVPEKLS